MDCRLYSRQRVYLLAKRAQFPQQYIHFGKIPQYKFALLGGVPFALHFSPNGVSGGIYDTLLDNLEDTVQYSSLILPKDHKVFPKKFTNLVPINTERW